MLLRLPFTTTTLLNKLLVMPLKLLAMQDRPLKMPIWATHQIFKVVLPMPHRLLLKRNKPPRKLKWIQPLQN